MIGNVNSSKWNKLIIGAFISVPILSSIISTVHIVSFFQLGNPLWIAMFLAVVFEVASISSILVTSVLKRINTWLIYGIFAIVAFLQIVGNVYFSYDWVTSAIATAGQTGGYLQNFMELFSPLIDLVFEENNEMNSKILLAYLIGVPIPLVSLAFSKSLTDYLQSDDDEEYQRISNPYYDDEQTGKTDGQNLVKWDIDNTNPPVNPDGFPSGRVEFVDHDTGNIDQLMDVMVEKRNEPAKTIRADGEPMTVPEKTIEPEPEVPKEDKKNDESRPDGIAGVPHFPSS